MLVGFVCGGGYFAGGQLQHMSAARVSSSPVLPLLRLFLHYRASHTAARCTASPNPAHVSCGTDGAQGQVLACHVLRHRGSRWPSFSLTSILAWPGAAAGVRRAFPYVSPEDIEPLIEAHAGAAPCCAKNVLLFWELCSPFAGLLLAAGFTPCTNHPQQRSGLQLLQAAARPGPARLPGCACLVLPTSPAVSCLGGWASTGGGH